MTTKAKEMSLFEQLESGLKDSIAYSKGELSLKTTELPEPPPAVSAEGIRGLRRSLHMSQAVFAAWLNVATKTVQSWEQGVRKPSDAALRLLQVVETAPQMVWIVYSGDAGKATRQARPVRMAAKRRPPHVQR